MKSHLYFSLFLFFNKEIENKRHKHKIIRIFPTLDLCLLIEKTRHLVTVRRNVTEKVSKNVTDVTDLTNIVDPDISFSPFRGRDVMEQSKNCF